MIAVKSHSPSPIPFPATVAEDLMTANPLSIQETLTVRESRNFFIDKAISGAPVIDAAGRPVGVLSQSDLLIHDRESLSSLGEHPVREAADTLVRDVMTQGVFSVGRHASIARVIGDMCEMNVHRLFVVDAAGILVGVISAMDVLKHFSRRFRDGGENR